MSDYKYLLKQTYETEHNLLDQYRKELGDLENNTGLATEMSKDQIEYWKVQLKQRILAKEKELIEMQKELYEEV